MSQHQIREVLASHPIVPVVVFQDGDPVLRFVDYLLENDIHCIEVTLRTSYAEKAIAEIKARYGNRIKVGAGTVIKQGQIERLKELKIDFLVSPGFTPSLIKAFEDSGVPYLPGVSTPSEIILALQTGLESLKFFPANLFGGLSALKTYGSVFPDVKFCPTGGVDKETYKDYLALPNVMSVGGSWIQKDFKY